MVLCTLENCGVFLRILTNFFTLLHDLKLHQKPNKTFTVEDENKTEIDWKLFALSFRECLVSTQGPLHLNSTQTQADMKKHIYWEEEIVSCLTKYFI